MDIIPQKKSRRNRFRIKIGAAEEGFEKNVPKGAFFYTYYRMLPKTIPTTKTERPTAVGNRTPSLNSGLKSSFLQVE